MKSTRKVLRKEFCDNVWHGEFDSEILVTRYSLWLEQKIVDLKRQNNFCICGIKKRKQFEIDMDQCRFCEKQITQID